MLVTIGVFVLNLLLYTAWDKKKGALSVSALTDVVLVSKGLGHTALELNKITGLTGLTLLALAFAPWGGLGLAPHSADRETLLYHAAVTQILHAMFSVAAFYGETHIPRIETWPEVLTELRSASRKVRLVGLRKISGIAGGMALAMLCWLGMGEADPTASLAISLTTVALGVVHFYCMEVDFKLIVQVRPFGFVPFVVCGVTLVALSLRLYLWARHGIA